MLLPQSDAFRSLNDRLTTVCNLRENLGMPPSIGPEVDPDAIITKKNVMNTDKLLKRFDAVTQQRRTAAKDEAEKTDSKKHFFSAPPERKLEVLTAGVSSPNGPDTWLPQVQGNGATTSIMASAQRRRPPAAPVNRGKPTGSQVREKNTERGTENSC
jgi:hypothetical protein